MKPAFALLPFLFLFMFAGTIESRKDQGEYWKMIMKDEEMPEGIQGLLQSAKSSNQQIDVGNSKHKCDDEEEHKMVTSNEYIIEKKVFNEELEPRPNISAYEDDHVSTKGTKKYTEDLEPRPNISAYDDDHVSTKGTKKYTEDLEPRPNISAYDDHHVSTKGTKKFMDEDFEPRPSVTSYSEEIVETFEPRPSVTSYIKDIGHIGEKLVQVVNNEFEPRPSATKYHD